ncbi:glutamine synthetase family protein [Asticcacaulis sp. BYS171W]|uniref:Glutamine synthetase family protein n=1 Tax=Asticcacaulis aquaticus TaxID=2984212 RepID=A0ABT5HQC1_9CAUL|nr:glutamine synthetase family protein [Asticcacaulis aquaticus]MDC7682270.1 glutamine synthetase family protein [Asticcacaulis aquaticus]
MKSKSKRPQTGFSKRGAANVSEAGAWLAEQNIEEIECMVPDLAGVARGKIMPVRKFLTTAAMNLPLSIFYQDITGDFPDLEGIVGTVQSDTDIFLQPDFNTLATVPWATDPTAQIIHDAYHPDGRPVEESPRQVLRKVLALYHERGWKPIIAPELEFYLVEKNIDPDYALKPPIGRSGRPETGRQGYSISAVNEFDSLFEDMYEYSESQGLEIDTLIHESGVAQMEINLRHGDPLELADQVFMFKRTIKETALEHDIYATFMAKPMALEPGSAMHIHQSIVDMKTGQNLFSDPKTGEPTPLFFSFIAGHQVHLPAATSLLAPYVNSYRRLSKGSGAPVNTHWGFDNRTAGLRVPPSDADNRRLECRIPSSDANPYLAIAATLACGYLGMIKAMTPDAPVDSDVSNDPSADLPYSLIQAVIKLERSEELREILGAQFVTAYARVKHHEYETFMRTISPWEREFLLLNV